jgi:DNA gyrase subunit A
MICIPLDKKCEVLVVSENGYGKRSDLDDYRITNRGGKGVKTLNITDKTGEVIAVKDVTDSDDLMIINRSGVIIRMAVANLRVMGRATQGVRLIKIDEGDSIAAVAKVDVEVAPEISDDAVSEFSDNADEIIREQEDEPIVNKETDEAETEN